MRLQRRLAHWLASLLHCLSQNVSLSLHSALTSHAAWWGLRFVTPWVFLGFGARLFDAGFDCASHVGIGRDVLLQPRKASIRVTIPCRFVFAQKAHLK